MIAVKGGKKTSRDNRRLSRRVQKVCEEENMYCHRQSCRLPPAGARQWRDPGYHIQWHVWHRNACCAEFRHENIDWSCFASAKSAIQSLSHRQPVIKILKGHFAKLIQQSYRGNVHNQCNHCRSTLLSLQWCAHRVLRATKMFSRGISRMNCGMNLLPRLSAEETVLFQSKNN